MAMKRRTGADHPITARERIRTLFFQVVWQGIDTPELTYAGQVSEEVDAELARLKGLAQSQELRTQPGPLNNSTPKMPQIGHQASESNPDQWTSAPGETKVRRRPAKRVSITGGDHHMHPASLVPGTYRAKVVRALVVSSALAASALNAQPSDPNQCTAQLNQGQNTIRELCASFAPCAFVYSFFDACFATKRWLDALGKDTPKEITLDTMKDALSTYPSTFEELPDDRRPRPGHCLPGPGFDKALCRQLVGLDPVPIPQPPPPPKSLTPEQDLRARVLALYEEARASRDKSLQPYRSAQQALEGCEGARQSTQRDATCGRAEKQVSECLMHHDDWKKRRDIAVADAERADPGIGQQYTPGISPLRGLGRQASRDEMWNDTVRGLRTLEMATCPQTLPSSFLTPRQALDAWAREDAAQLAKPGEALQRRVTSVERTHFEQIVREVDASATLRAQREAQEREQAAAAHARAAAQQAAQGSAASNYPSPGTWMNGKWQGDNNVQANLDSRPNGFDSSTNRGSGYFFQWLGGSRFRYVEGPNECIVAFQGPTRYAYSCNGVHIANFERMGAPASAPSSVPTSQPTQAARPSGSGTGSGSAPCGCIASAALCRQAMPNWPNSCERR